MEDNSLPTLGGKVAIKIRNIDEGKVTKSYVNLMASKLEKDVVSKDKNSLQK